MKVRLEIGGSIMAERGRLEVGPTLDLLDGIAQERTVRGAANRLALSYRSTWGKVSELERVTGKAVVVKTKGHGTVLTPFGEGLRQELRSTFERLEAALAREQRDLAARLERLDRQIAPRLQIAASHDPLLVQALAAVPGVELRVTGSSEALRLLRAGEADIAGCHFGTAQGRPGSSLAASAMAGLVSYPVFNRDQGFIVPRGNPLGIRSVQDIARLKARFVNRQKGSGTRAWFDRLLGRAGIEPKEIAGYSVEEFTHQAVAATVAAGGADVGLGVRVVADVLGLTFVPVGEETYYLAARDDRVADGVEAIAAQIAALIGSYPGYRLPGPARAGRTSRGKAAAVPSGRGESRRLDAGGGK